MKRLTIVLEDYDDSKVIRSTILEQESEVEPSRQALEKTGVHFSIDDVNDDLYDFQLDDGDCHVDLALRTRKELEEWLNRQLFETLIKEFFEIRFSSLKLLLNRCDSYVKIELIRRSVTS